MSSTDRGYGIQCYQLTENMIFSKSLTLPYYLFNCKTISGIDWPRIWPIPYHLSYSTIIYHTVMTVRQKKLSTDRAYDRSLFPNPTLWQCHQLRPYPLPYSTTLYHASSTVWYTICDRTWPSILPCTFDYHAPHVHLSASYHFHV